MKKLFVILLAVALTLSLAVVASAATFSPYVGGEFQLTYRSDGDTSPFSLGDGNNSMLKAYVQGKVEDADTNTWAQIGAKLTCWNRNGGDKLVQDPDANHGTGVENWVPGTTTWEILYSVGIKKVGGILDIQFSTDDYEATLRGQTPLNNGAYKFGGDPFFCNRINNSFGFDINSDSVTVNIGTTAGIANANELGKVIVASGTVKFDAGQVYAGYAKLSDTNSNFIVGGQFKAGDALTIKADYYSVNTGSTASTFQGSVSFDELKLAATLMYDLKNRFATATDNTIGVGVEYSGVDKLSLGAKYFNTTDAAYEVYGIYKLGVIDVRPGYADDGAGDGYFYLAAHVGLW